MKKAVFLDRDGVINKEVGDYVYRVKDFKFNEGLFDALRLLKEHNYELIVITNQGGVAKEIYSSKDVFLVHQHMQKRLLEEGIDLVDIYYCPHHHTVSNCLCRKPNSIMIERAIAKHDIDVSNSFLIGDSLRDVQAAEKTGLKGLLIKPNTNLFSFINEAIIDVV